MRSESGHGVNSQVATGNSGVGNLSCSLETNMVDVDVGSQRRESEAFDSSEQARHEALYRNNLFSK